MPIVSRILELSRKNGYTQASLADTLNNFGIVNVKKQTITDWKAGKSNSYFLLLEQLSQILDVSIDFLVCGKDSKPDLTSNEIEMLHIFNKLKSEKDQSKLLGYAECYVDSILHNHSADEGADAQQRLDKTS